MRNPLIFGPEPFASYSGTPNNLEEVFPSEQFAGVWSDSEFDQEREARADSKQSSVRARILWPALGFPAVVTPSSRPSSNTFRNGDATKCICVLVLSDKRQLTSQDAARYLRCVPWACRGRRHIAENSFAATELSVRNDVNNVLTIAGRKDAFGEHVRFGANGKGQNGIVACLAGKVRSLYRDARLAYLHEIRVSEAATARLQGGVQYHLFWNNERAGEGALSDEMNLLIDRHARQGAKFKSAVASQRDFLLTEYKFEYGGLHAPYNRNQESKPAIPAEILHPVFIWRSSGAPLRIGHVTDTHVDVRADVYGHNIEAAKIRSRATNANDVFKKSEVEYNNFNRSFENVYNHAKNSDVLLMTGDLIDYGRGHWGLGRPNQLQDDGAYHVDRNWFLFYYLLAAGESYTKPSYTILGNHDWRLNPYPPFGPGAPKPNELLHDFGALTRKEQEKVIQLAHGPGFNRGYSYTTKAENIWSLLWNETGSALKAFAKLVKQSSSLDVKGYPTETNIDSIAWYLFSINPFLDYAFTLPGKQSVVMLDWAKTEHVLFEDVVKGEKWGYDPLNPNSASGTPKASSCLTGLQQRLVADFCSGPSKAKVVGLHAPPISAYSDWYQSDLLTGRKTYKNPQTARGPNGGHPLFAITPRGAPYGMAGERGSFVKGRDGFIKMLADPKYSVRMVLSGHVHRNGLYVVYASKQEIYVKTPKDIVKEWRLKNPLLMRGVPNAAVRSARPPYVTLDRTRGPLYVTTTSAGPRGSFEDRPLMTEMEHDRGITTEPGWAQLELAGDGTIKKAEFRRPPRMAAAQRPSQPAAQREVALGIW